jgi:hypothetical protein
VSEHHDEEDRDLGERLREYYAARYTPAQRTDQLWNHLAPALGPQSLPPERAEIGSRRAVWVATLLLLVVMAGILVAGGFFDSTHSAGLIGGSPSPQPNNSDPWSRMMPMSQTLDPAPGCDPAAANVDFTCLLDQFEMNDPRLDEILRAHVPQAVNVQQTVAGWTIAVRRVYADSDVIMIGYLVSGHAVGPSSRIESTALSLTDDQGQAYRLQRIVVPAAETPIRPPAIHDEQYGEWALFAGPDSREERPALQLRFTIARLSFANSRPPMLYDTVGMSEEAVTQWEQMVANWPTPVPTIERPFSFAVKTPFRLLPPTLTPIPPIPTIPRPIPPPQSTGEPALVP